MMTIIQTPLSEQLSTFIDQQREIAEYAFEVFRQSNTITANGTVNFVERVPFEDKLITINYAGPWKRDVKSIVSVETLDGEVVLGRKAGGGRYNKLFREHADVTTISHVHAPNLGAWAQTHRTLPVRYVPVQRFHLFNELPNYIDRRQAEVDFILDQLKVDIEHRAILEANGGATVWGRKGLQETAEFILLLEEGAQIQLLAELVGGSRAYGSGVLHQQWKMSGLTEKAKALGLLPA
ncbi:class II aldolase/adducin family protein [Acinetobacter sp. ANC 5380]|uniref:Class II aldolase/adducin family protein n=1 Tax=Acinetobacter terrae TaxID=2731247 RepID=A0A7Y2RD84_9GAMM|nr:class II aldolase/adducin family protein [Acinetobacter terrae]